jgi:hypothetical protein
MEIKTPIIKHRTGVGQAFDELVKKFPILAWEQEQKKRRAKIKF